MRYKIDISHRTILFIIAVVISLWITYLILDVILLLFVSFILVSALNPAVHKLEQLKFPRFLAVFLVFFVTVFIIISLLALGFTPLIRQTTNLSAKLGEAVAQLLKTNLVDKSIINDEMTNLSHQLLNITLDVAQNLVSLVSLVVISFYLLLDKEKIEDLIAAFFLNNQSKARNFLQKLEEKLGAWLRGQLALSVLVGLLVYLGLTILGVQYALPLAIISGLLEVVPVIGPLIAAIPGVLIGLTVSPFLAVLVAALYLAVQQVESHVIVPQVMKRAVGLNPILVILAVTVGSRLLGISGALLAVPIAVVIQVVLEEVLHEPQKLFV